MIVPHFPIPSTLTASRHGEHAAKGKWQRVRKRVGRIQPKMHCTSSALGVAEHLGVMRGHGHIASPRVREAESSRTPLLRPDRNRTLIAFVVALQRASLDSGATSFPPRCTPFCQTACVPRPALQCHNCRAGDSAF